MALLPLLMLGLPGAGAIAADIGELAGAVALALLANAFVCGVLSNPHDRYGARVAWLAVLVGLSWPLLTDDRASASANSRAEFEPSVLSLCEANGAGEWRTLR